MRHFCLCEYPPKCVRVAEKNFIRKVVVQPIDVYVMAGLSCCVNCTLYGCRCKSKRKIHRIVCAGIKSELLTLSFTVAIFGV